MNNFEKQLNNLPRARLSRRADLLIRYKLMCASLKQYFSGVSFNFFAAARLRPVLAAVVILALVFSGGTSVYAYNSSQITRASALYPVKRGLEKIESRFATTPAAQVKFHNKLAGRRILEAQFLSLGSAAFTADQTASSTGEALPVKLEYENEFNDTLRDADDEIERANERAREIGDRTELDRSLALLSDAHLNELGKIKAMAEAVGIEADDRTTDNIALILENIKGRQQRIVRAISQFDGDLKRAGENEDDEDGASASSSEKNIAKGQLASTTPDEAASSLDRVRNEIKVLESELSQGGRISNKQIKRLTERLNKKINQAETAIQAGDVNKFNGLLRATEALTNNGQHFLKENNKEEKQIEGLPLNNFGDKVKAQYNLKEIQAKLEEQRKKQAEKLREELKKAAEQNQENGTIKIDDRTATSSVNVLSDQKNNSSADQTASSSVDN